MTEPLAVAAALRQAEVGVVDDRDVVVPAGIGLVLEMQHQRPLVAYVGVEDAFERDLPPPSQKGCLLQTFEAQSAGPLHQRVQFGEAGCGTGDVADHNVVLSDVAVHADHITMAVVGLGVPIVILAHVEVVIAWRGQWQAGRLRVGGQGRETEAEGNEQGASGIHGSIPRQ